MGGAVNAAQEPLASPVTHSQPGMARPVICIIPGKAEPSHATKKPALPAVGRILLVDDNDACRNTTKWLLGRLGYTLDAAASAEQGLARFNPAIHRLVITDNFMPGMTGREMAKVIKQRSPCTPVLMYSGNPPQDRSCLDIVIQKPAHLLRLKDAIDELLRAGGQARVNSPAPADSQ